MNLHFDEGIPHSDEGRNLKKEIILILTSGGKNATEVHEENCELSGSGVFPRAKNLSNL
ncbi:MAG: hypothetical protein IJ756_02710 [Paludibacteraceae bacterium]|nr:hypothetical protein [Paludibacteraceae bacterium]